MKDKPVVTSDTIPLDRRILVAREFCGDAVVDSKITGNLSDEEKHQVLDTLNIPRDENIQVEY